MDPQEELANLLAAPSHNFESFSQVAYLSLSLNRPYRCLQAVTEALALDEARERLGEEVALKGLRAQAVLTMERKDEVYYEEDVERMCFLRQLVADLRAQPEPLTSDLEYANLLLSGDLHSSETGLVRKHRPSSASSSRPHSARRRTPSSGSLRAQSREGREGEARTPRGARRLAGSSSTPELGESA